jgi:hypothetical protein
MKPFPFIKIENKNYPSVIMGEDNFTGWFGKGNFATEEERAKAYKETLEAAYALGVRGFSMSPQRTLMKVLKDFKVKNPDIVCISNHHWQSHYFFGSESLWKEKNLKRLAATDATLIDSALRKACNWFQDVNIKDAFSNEEIGKFSLDEKEYKQQLAEFKPFCDFCLIGNIGASSLVVLGRKDIVKKEIELVREAGLIPIGMCQGGGLALLMIEELDVAGSWLWINKDFCYPNLGQSLKAIKKAKKPITAYKILSSLKGLDIEASAKFIKSIKQIKSIVVGVENRQQAKETFSKLRAGLDSNLQKLHFCSSKNL